jgi:hypothetical protein
MFLVAEEGTLSSFPGVKEVIQLSFGSRAPRRAHIGSGRLGGKEEIDPVRHRPAALGHRNPISPIQEKIAGIGHNIMSKRKNHLTTR